MSPETRLATEHVIQSQFRSSVPAHDSYREFSDDRERWITCYATGWSVTDRRYGHLASELDYSEALPWLEHTDCVLVYTSIELPPEPVLQPLVTYVTCAVCFYEKPRGQRCGLPCV